MRPSPPSYLRATGARASRPWGWMCLVALAWSLSGTGCSVISAPYGAVTGPVGFFRDHAAYNDASESLVLGWRNHVWSKRAWYQQRHLFVSHAHVKDFGKGFQAGYNEVANGGDGCVPVLPPREYWSWRYQSPEGQGKTAAWFEGYPLGAAAADKDGIANWGHIQTGYTADSKSIRGRANYVRIREDLLKKEMRKESEEVNPPGPSGMVPGVLTPSEPDDLPPPRPRPNPPAIDAPKTPDAQPNNVPQINPPPPVLPNPAGPSGTDDSARINPVVPSAPPAPTLVRLPAVEPEPMPIQHAHVQVPASTDPRANPFDTRVVSEVHQSDAPSPVMAAPPAVSDTNEANPVAAAPSKEPRKSWIGTVSHATLSKPLERTVTGDVQQPAASYKRSVALYPAGERDDPPTMKSEGAAEPKSEGEPDAAAQASSNAASPAIPLPPMRQLRRNAELPEAPVPSPISPGSRIAREVFREDRTLRAERGGPILERRENAPAGEIRLSDIP